MAKIVIKRRIAFDFLGDQYKDAYMIFRAIPIADYEVILKDMPKEGEAADASIRKVIDVLKRYFISGEFPDDEGKAQTLTDDDIGDLDQDTAIRCFEALTGQYQDPKAGASSTTPSTTDEAPPSSS